VIRKVNALAQAHMIRLLLEGTYTVHEIAAESGLHFTTVSEYARALHHVGAAHISMWEKDSLGRDCIMIYKLGPGRDAKRSRKTPAERAAGRRSRIKAARDLMVTAGRGRYVKAANGRLRFEEVTP
jgi:hypothetical protein